LPRKEGENRSVIARKTPGEMKASTAKGKEEAIKNN